MQLCDLGLVTSLMPCIEVPHLDTGKLASPRARHPGAYPDLAKGNPTCPPSCPHFTPAAHRAPGIEEDVDLAMGSKGSWNSPAFCSVCDSELKLADDGAGGGVDPQVQILPAGLGHLGLPASTAPLAHRMITTWVPCPPRDCFGGNTD